jgi:inner membrane protein|uniref:Inner membrane protein CreD-like protein n=1 Tax=uncultured bacterium A1Q1_fos_300 TaxID=1256571 RepID=L7VRQ9_9BACT|nr:inner membrane protein CreD-like protein [uncultured bacterium A1Q1_fos_300]
MRRSKLSTQILWVGLITILLTVIATMILPLVRERSLRREKVLADMTRIWGQPHLILGPVAYGAGGAVEIRRFRIDGDIKTSLRRKGIYRFPFYSAKLDMTGKLAASAGRVVVLSRSRLQIDSASLGNRAVFFGEQNESGVYTYRANVAGQSGDELKISLSCEGLQSLSFAPTTVTAEVRLKSDWNDPGFFGDFLPAEYDISKSGFSASWKLHLPRYKAPDEKYLHLPSATEPEADATDSVIQRRSEVATATALQPVPGRYGVNFYQPVDIYQATERSVKYAILFIALTFLTLVLFETISSAEIHPMQYLMAGSALVIFYLLLLALAEYTGFTIAYIAAAGANVLLLAKYSGSFLLNRRHSMAFASVITLLYSLLYVILQLEEFALIAGASTLFLALVATMYLTRKLDWYGPKA